MAAMRSVLARLGRQCGSSAGSTMGGRGLEIHQVLLPAAPRMPPLPSLRAASTRTPPPPQSLRPSAHRGLRRYSSECSGGSAHADKNKLLLMNENSNNRPFHLWEQRPRGVKAVLEADHYLLVLALFGVTVSTGYMMTQLWQRKLMPFSGPRTRVPDVNYDDYEDIDEDDDD